MKQSCNSLVFGPAVFQDQAGHSQKMAQVGCIVVIAFASLTLVEFESETQSF
jgi:hypothetical protein